jgi:hypothetical protein
MFLTHSAFALLHEFIPTVLELEIASEMKLLTYTEF